VPETNPEVVRAKELGIPVWPRAKMLSALSRGRRTVAVAGTHGKTTTSSMTATMLANMGLDPSFLIGGIVEDFDTNGRNGSGDLYVAEADESDASFLLLDPDIVVVTNIEADHLDHYGSLEAIEEAFSQFMASAGEDGTVICCGENPHVVELARAAGPRVVSYGFGGQNNVVCTPDAATRSISSSMEVGFPDGQLAHVTIKGNPGSHNQLNATAALTVAWVLGLDIAEAARALSEFGGVRRRFTHVGDVAGVTVVDDYGHHPTEVAATLAAASGLDFDRVVVAFQPHRYSRTQALAPQFAHAFDDADALLVMDVFPAGEMPADDLAHGAEVGRDLPVRRGHPSVLVRLGEQVPGEALLKGREGDLVEEPEQDGHELGVIVEDEGAERGRGRHEVPEGLRRKRRQHRALLRDALGREGAAGEQALGREDAGPPGTHPVDQHLAAARGDPEDACPALDAHQVVRALASQLVGGRSRLQHGKAHGAAQDVPVVGRKRPEHGKLLEPALDAVGVRHAR